MSPKPAATLFLILTVTQVLAGAYASARWKPGGDKTFIRRSCLATTYPSLCFESLSVFAPTIRTSPRLLIHTALAVSLHRTTSVRRFVSRASRLRGLSKRQYQAVRDCMEEMEDTIDRLSKSIHELKRWGGSRGSEYLFHMSNVQTWMSAAITDENTCADGFTGKAMDGRLKNSIRARILDVSRVTSNALALINNYVSRN